MAAEALPDNQMPDKKNNKISGGIFNLLEKYEETEVQQNLTKLEEQILPDKMDLWEKTDTDDKQTLAVIAGCSDEELNILKDNHVQIGSTTGIHNFAGHMKTLHILTGNNRYIPND